MHSALRQALHAEWTKARTLPGTGWLLLAAVGLTVVVGRGGSGRQVPSGTAPRPRQDQPAGIYLGQAVIAIVAVLAISSEYSTGMIRITLAAMPRRPAVLAAKAACSPARCSPPAPSPCSARAGRAADPARPRHRSRARLSGPVPGGRAVLRAACGSVLYLGLIPPLSLGIATAVRDAAAAIGIVLAPLYLFPIFTEVVDSATWRRHLEQFGPMTAGLAIQATTGLRTCRSALGGPWRARCLGRLGAVGRRAAAAASVTLRTTQHRAQPRDRPAIWPETVTMRRQTDTTQHRAGYPNRLA